MAVQVSSLPFKMLHGGDYNPDQWLDRPDILERDIELMKKSRVNCVSVAIFSWSRLEPRDGAYDFDWLSSVIDSLYENGVSTILATPSGARPAWMAKKYPEVLRTSADLTKDQFGCRHNHCLTSPVYRKKVWEINRRLSERFGRHPGVILWHLSNEYSGECFCPLCQEAFRGWLKKKYKTLNALNQAWWTSFWSHTYGGWDEIEAPVPSGETGTHGLSLDWKRFVTDQTVSFAKNELDAIRAGGSALPVTSNLMGFYPGLNYFKFKDLLDIVSWDNYPDWNHFEDETPAAVLTACTHDLMRSIKGKPFLMMETSPNTVNWRPVSHVLRPGMLMLSSMQAVAHGSNSVQYFQWRQSRGNSEKFHSAIVDHYGGEDTRVFSMVSEVGRRLSLLDEVCAANVKPEIAILFDWENRWALEESRGPRNGCIHYQETVLAHYQAFWSLGIPTDLVDMECDLSGYRLVVTPLLYLYRAGIAEKLRQFTENGGVLVGTYLNGVVDENDLCFLGGVPAQGMGEVFGLRSEEIDALYDHQENSMTWRGRTYRITELCDMVRLQGAAPLAVYSSDFYAGYPALSSHAFGKGTAYYIAGRAEDGFYTDFYDHVSKEAGIRRALDAVLPRGVTANVRTGKRDIVIVQNYNAAPATVLLNRPMTDLETGKPYQERLELRGFEARFLTE